MKPLGISVYSSPVRDPRPVEGLAYGVIAFVGICAVLYFGRDVLIPVTLALLFSVFLAPLVKGLQRLRFPKAVAVTSVVILFVVLAAGTGMLVARTLTGLAADLPRYEASLREKARTLKVFTGKSGAIDKAAGVLDKLQNELADAPAQGARAEERPIPVELRDNRFGPLEPVVSVVAMVAHPLVQAGIVVLMLVFVLFNRENLKDRFIRLAGTADLHRTTAALDEAGKRLSRMILGQLAINASTGTFIAVSLFLLGIPGAFLWGVLTAVLRFVPFVGTFLAAVFPIVIALAIGDGWTLPLIVAGIVIASEFIAGQVLEPVFLGRMTGVSSIAIVVSAAFWAMLWGPVGLILATPIAVSLMVLGRHIESLNFLNVLFGNEPVLNPEEAFYQRLLAGDSVDAVQAADLSEKSDLPAFLQDVAIPALAIADADVKRSVLGKDRATGIAHTFSDVLDELVPVENSSNAAVAPVLVAANHGAINFAAALAFSALLHLRNIPHRMLPQDAVAPGKFPDIDISGVSYLCLVSLAAPSEAQVNYVTRRLRARLGDAKIINVAWQETGESESSLQALSVLSMLPQSEVKEAEPAPNAAAA